MMFSDEQLLSSCIKQGKNAENEIVCNDEMSQLVTRYMRIITIKAHKMKCASIEFDDLVSEGFMGLLNAMKSFSEDKGKFFSFANVCITNKMLNALNKAKTFPALVDDFDLTSVEDISADTENLIIAREESDEIYSAMREILTKRELEVMNLYLNSYSYQQIAMILGITIKSVDNALSRARKKMKSRFSKD